MHPMGMKGAVLIMHDASVLYAQNFHDPCCCFTIPQSRMFGWLLPVIEHMRGCFQDGLRINTGKMIGPFGNSDRSFSIVPKSYAGYSQNRCFFLNAARVGEHDAGMRGEFEKVEIAEGGHKTYIFPEDDAVFLYAFLGPGMNRKDNGQRFGNFDQCLNYSREDCRIVDIGRSVQSKHGVW